MIIWAIWLCLTGALAKRDRNCDDKFCLTSFRWCDSTLDDFPDNVLPIRDPPNSRGTGCGVLLGTDEYNITWIHAASDHPVTIEWQFRAGEPDSGYSTGPHSWEFNTTDSYYVFRPYDLFAKMASSQEFKLTESEIRDRATGMINFIVIKQPGKGTGQEGWRDTSLEFSVQNRWAIEAAMLQYELGKQKETPSWRLGVGLGVGLGVPFLMAITGLLTWWFTKKRLTSTGPLKITT